MSEDDAGESWDLGWLDCDTCGGNSESADAELSPDGTVTLTLRYGCYSGDTYTGTPADVLDRFRGDWPTDRRNTFDNPNAFTEIETWLTRQ